MRIAPIITALALAGCASSITDYRAEKPTVSYATNKAPDAALRCLAAAFERMGDAPVMTASSVGQTLTWRGSSRMFVDIVTAPTGSIITYHQHGVIDAGQRYISAVNSCRD